MSLDLLSQLEEQFPVNRQINIEGFDRPLWVWRLETEQILQVAKTGKLESDQARIEFSLLLVGMAIGDEVGPGAFDNDRGRAFLRRQPHMLAALAKTVREFNELEGPSESRKKSSETASSSETSSPLPEGSDSAIHDESSSNSAAEL